MSGTEGFAQSMGQISQKLLQLHKMDDSDWNGAAAVLREVARLAMAASFYCEQEAHQNARTRVPALEPE